MRREISNQCMASLSLSLNIPGFPKSDESIGRFFGIVLADLKRHLIAHRVFLIDSQSRREIDKAGDFFIGPLKDNSFDLQRVKEVCENFEESYPLGRAVDIDITGLDFTPISSGKAKRCFICKDRPAVLCMREETHGKEELRDYLFRELGIFLERRTREDICRRLSSFAVKAILYEVSVTPKPGAVDRFDAGCHEDMDFFTFMNSASALSQRFVEFAGAGYDFPLHRELSEALPIIRYTGLAMEEEMFRETGGVNTQKGIIFLTGLTLFAAAYLLKQGKGFVLEQFVLTLRKMTVGLTGAELGVPAKNEQKNRVQKGAQEFNGLTHGETCFRKYGPQLGAGARYEAEQGFPTVMEFGLPVLKETLAMKSAATLTGNPVESPGLSLGDLPIFYRELDVKEAAADVLLSLMSENNDSNILYRKGPEQLAELKRLSGRVLATGSQKEKEDAFQVLTDYCIAQNISPGGSIDLLAVTFLIYFIETEFAVHGGLRET